MQELKFRNLEAHEIECKAIVNGNSIEISLYAKASTCTQLLNETVGAYNWEKEYTNGNKNCIVRIWDKEKNRMISKEDCGGGLTEVNGYKGQASNGFKRVCALGWGLGIELYSQPAIIIPKTDNNVIYDAASKEVVSERYEVKEIEYDDNKKITHCVITNSRGQVVYDGPREDGESIVIPDEDEERVVIPENADVINNEDYEDDLPDNTDGFEESEVTMTNISQQNYVEEFEAEIERTHVKRMDVLNVLKISSFDQLSDVPENIINETLDKLRARKTYTYNK